MTLGNGVAETFGYDANRLQLTSQVATKSGGPAGGLMNVTYDYQAAAGKMGAGSTAGNAGQLMAISGTINSTTESAAYSYDNLGRLVTSNQTTNGSSAQRKFAYDRWGNRTTVWQSLFGGTPIQTVALEQSGGAPTNRITSVTNSGVTVNYSYDAAGNVTNDGAHTYQYDADNRLVNVDSGATAQYKYDHQNRRVSKIIGSSWTHYVWQGGQVIGEHDATTAYTTNPTYQVNSARLDYVYSGSQRIYSRERATSGGSWTTKYYLSDRLSTRLVLDTSGNVTGRQAHLPFGEDFGESGTQEKHQFTSYERDGESGTDYAINREYSQSVGRFMRVDPYDGSNDIYRPQSLNRFAYVQGNPINATDPKGLNVAWDCWTSIGGGDGEPLFWVTTCRPFGYGGGGGGLDPGSGSGSGNAGIKAPLTGKKLKKYNEERAKARNKLMNSEKCRQFLSSHDISPDALLDALDKQRAYDGANSTISLLDAGLVDPSGIDWTIPQAAANALGPVSGPFTSNGALQTQAWTAFWVGGSLGTTVDSRSDVYFRGSGISASTILHEALHSLLGEEDPALALRLRVTLNDSATSPISQALHDNDCGG